MALRTLRRAALALPLLLAACADPDATTDDALDPAADTLADAAPTMQTALAVMQPQDGATVSGTVRFEPATNGIRVTANLEGLEGAHGFHIHENATCADPGSHFSPEGSEHGAPTEPLESRHAGDLGNVEADANGALQTSMVAEGLSMEGDYGIVGRTVVLHGGRDDLTSQPSGDAGPIVACGEIRAE